MGSPTTVWWAVKFPDAEGFRHPVVLYVGLENLLLIPVLMHAAGRRLPTGVLTGIFLFLYVFLSIFVDVFREYPTSLLGLATRQFLNLLMSVVGLTLIAAPRGGGCRTARRSPARNPDLAPRPVRLHPHLFADQPQRLDPGHPGPVRQAARRAGT